MVDLIIGGSSQHARLAEILVLRRITADDVGSHEPQAILAAMPQARGT
jgi:hypothetical protein